MSEMPAADETLDAPLIWLGRDAELGRHHKRMLLCLKALGRHPTLPDELHRLPLLVLAEAGAEWLTGGGLRHTGIRLHTYSSCLAAYALLVRYFELWRRAPGLRPELWNPAFGLAVLFDAVVRERDWAGLVADVERRTHRVAILHARDLRGHASFDAQAQIITVAVAWSPHARPDVKTVDQVRVLSCEALSNLFLAMEAGLRPSLSLPLAGPTPRYPQLLDVYDRMSRAGVGRTMTQGAFIAQVQEGRISVPGWDERTPDASAVRQRLGVVDPWLRPVTPPPTWTVRTSAVVDTLEADASCPMAVQRSTIGVATDEGTPMLMYQQLDYSAPITWDFDGVPYSVRTLRVLVLPTPAC